MDLPEARTVLGVRIETPWAEVRATYLRLVQEHHPDRAADLADQGLRTVQTAQLTQAYSTLVVWQREVADRSDGSDGSDEGERSSAAPGRRSGGPWVVPEPGPFDSRSVMLDATMAESFQALLEAGHLIGEVTYVDRLSGVLEVIVVPEPGQATSVLVYLESRGAYTEAVLGVEPLGGHAPASLDALVDRFAELISH